MSRQARIDARELLAHALAQPERVDRAVDDTPVRRVAIMCVMIAPAQIEPFDAAHGLRKGLTRSVYGPVARADLGKPLDSKVRNRLRAQACQ